MNNIPVKKNEKYVVDIVDNGIAGEGIAKIDNFAIFIPNAIKGEKCEILIVKVLSSHAYGKLINVIKQSDSRVEPDCLSYYRCGGCSLRHMSYEATLEYKVNRVQNLVDKTLSEKIKVNKTIGMENPKYYRNKAIYPVSSLGKPGIYAERTHDIIPFEECYIQTKKSQEIAKEICSMYKGSIYDEKTGKGCLRNIMIREAFATKEIMVVLVINDDNIELNIDKLLELEPNIKTIILNINKKNTNVVLSNENKIVYGDGYITDFLGSYKFKISPNSFYQINPIQTEKIYNLAIEMAELDKKDILFDLYCGIGTIGIFASKFVNKVYGIEIVPQAVEDAKENAKINNVENAEFVAGDVEEVFDNLLNKENIIPSAIIVDPPRKGLDNKTIGNILKVKPEKLIYISCNPATLVRDLKELEEVYEIKKIQPVDFFPYTKHVECCAVMELKNSL